jgi:hypothetical protein
LSVPAAKSPELLCLPELASRWPLATAEAVAELWPVVRGRASAHGDELPWALSVLS